MFHNIPTLFEILSNSFHKIEFIYKSRMGVFFDCYIAVVFDLRTETLFS